LVRDAARALGYNISVDARSGGKSQESTVGIDGKNTLTELDAIVSSVADAVLVFDAAGSVSFLNASAERFFGPPSGSLTDNLFHKPVLWKIDENGKPSRPFSRECLNQVTKDARSMVTEVVNLHNPDNPRWFLANLSPFFDEDKSAKGVILALTEITSLKKRRERHSSRFKEAFDELKTPITVIRGHAQIIADSLHTSSGTPPDAEQIEAILCSVERIEQILSDLIKQELGSK